MTSLRLATASNVRAFQNLTTTLSTSNRKWAHAIDQEALEDEVGRFRVWAGNLGALQKGHSSLDYRLRDSPVSSNNILKLLQELETNANEAYAVVSGARLPYEEQTPPDFTEAEDNDDGFFSAEEDDEDSNCDEPRTELKMRFTEIVDIIDNLYKLSVRIRTPGLRSRSLKASSYTQKDPETGVDIFEMYAAHDFNHVKELISHLRQPYVQESAQDELDSLVKRLSASVTLRRRHFKYWKRHRDKLCAATVADEVQELHITMPLEGPTPARNDGPETPPTVAVVMPLREAPSQKTSKTLLSGTEVTQLHQPLDDIVDTKSVTSYAITVRDVHGKSIDLPPPPKAANGDKDFECPYCWIVCPARYSKGRAWRTHLLQDLQPYNCTYLECESSHLLFRSRREWAEHEASHRKVWRCPEHPDAVFSSQSGLENHLRQRHIDSIPEGQLETIAKVGEASAMDMREKCPICCAPAGTKEVGELQSHIANHLERIATFALPHSNEDDSDGASGIASPGSTSSKSLLGSVSTDIGDGQNQQKENDESAILQSEKPEHVDVGAPGRDLLSTENLQQLPDTSKNMLDVILEQSNDPNSPYHQELADKPKRPQTLGINDIPTLRSLYRSRRILQADQSYAPNDAYNRMISFCYHDLTKLRVDAIVNNAPRILTRTPTPGTLHHAIMTAGGSPLIQELKSAAELKPGSVAWTLGHALPSSLVLHAAAPVFVGDGVVQLIILGDCYRNALNLAAALGIKTIAFPCLGTGGCGFSPHQAARIALQAVRDDLDARSENRLERIVFCVRSAADEQAYMDFFPVYFPPTHSDLDMARRSKRSANHARLVAQILNTWAQVQKTAMALSSISIDDDAEAKKDITRLAAIESGLHMMHKDASEYELLEENQENLNLLSFVLLNLCTSITEMAKLARDRATGAYQTLRGKTDQNMRIKHGFNFGQCLEYCSSFTFGLIGILTVGRPDLNMAEIRPKLESYRAMEMPPPEGVSEQTDEATSVQHLILPTSRRRRSLVKLHQIPSVARLYQLGAIEAKSTLARPSASFNDTVCMIKEDITKLEVDVIVNLTDTSFQGMGTLDRTVFKKGGPELQSEIEKFVGCKIGDVVTTQGYLLPAKHVLHAIPPSLFRKDTKNVLRNLYREILLKATYLDAKSVAIPCVGTNPPRDCASLAMEEVRRFLQSKEPGGLEKIVFTVYSANDEFIYKSLLPNYFPPLQESAPSRSKNKSLEKTEAPPSQTTADVSDLHSNHSQDLLQRLLDDKPLTMIYAKVSMSHDAQAAVQPLDKNACLVRVLVSSVTVHNVTEFSDFNTLLLSFSMTPASTWHSQKGPLDVVISDRPIVSWDVVISEVQRASAPPGDRAFVYFRCTDKTDADLLCQALEQSSNYAAQEQNQGEKKGDGGSPSTPGKGKAISDSGADPSITSSSKDDESLSIDYQQPAVFPSTTGDEYENFIGSGEPFPIFYKKMLQKMEKKGRAASGRHGEIDASLILEEKPRDSHPEPLPSSHQGDQAHHAPDAERQQEQAADKHKDKKEEKEKEKQNLDSLSTAILTHLTNDLRLRPTSYIGQHISDMAAALNMDIATLAVHLSDLAAQGKVHTTVDADTWVVSGYGDEMAPVFSGQDAK